MAYIVILTSFQTASAIIYSTNYGATSLSQMTACCTVNLNLKDEIL